MTIEQDVLGCDIAKHHLDIFDARSGTLRRIANKDCDIAAFAAALAGRDCLVVFEATGQYDARLRRALAAAGIAHARVNPGQARDFARAIGRRAKTDALDARMLAELGLRLDPRRHDTPDPDRERLAALSRRRDQLVAMRKQERVRASENPEPLLDDSLEAHLAWLDQAVAALDQAIQALLRASSRLAHASRLLCSVPGVGPVTATVLLAHLPELGRRSPKTIAALAGLAPYNNDSGAFRGKRSVKGGRPRIRQALYMAALSASRTNPRLAPFYNSLKSAGKPPKLALIAVARKLLVTLNAIARDRSPFLLPSQHSCRLAPG